VADAGLTLADMDAVVVGKAPDLFEGVMMPELYLADEVFLCGTGVQIAPVTNIDGRQIGSGKPGTVTMELQEFYLAIVRGISEDFPEWRLPVYADGRGGDG